MPGQKDAVKEQTGAVQSEPVGLGKMLGRLGIALHEEFRPAKGMCVLEDGKQHNWLVLATNYSRNGMHKEAEYARTLYDIMDFEAATGLKRTFAPASCEYRSVVRLLWHFGEESGVDTDALYRVVGTAAEYLRLVSREEVSSIDSHINLETYACEAKLLEELLEAARHKGLLRILNPGDISPPVPQGNTSP
jgi:hypothetical protein